MKKSNWQVSFKRTVEKRLAKLPKHVVFAARALACEIETSGPLRYNWKNFGKIEGMENCYHCHLKKGKPTYVACWEVKNKQIKILYL